MQRRSKKFQVLSLHKLAKKSRKCCSIVVTGVASYGALGHVFPSTFNNFIFSSLWSKSESQLSTYCVVCEIRMQLSTTHSSFDQYCVRHKTIIHRAAAAPGPSDIQVVKTAVIYMNGMIAMVKICEIAFTI